MLDKRQVAGFVRHDRPFRQEQRQFIVALLPLQDINELLTELW